MNHTYSSKKPLKVKMFKMSYQVKKTSSQPKEEEEEEVVEEDDEQKRRIAQHP